ncbi:MAG: hypothetical protein Q27BB25_00600 [Blastomonas sp. CACIA14H2]|nr:MAG: hypothetical protein Q27BB25_00600 [Blastomonas sp. CACIA14H2]
MAPEAVLYHAHSGATAIRLAIFSGAAARKPFAGEPCKIQVA